MLGVPAAGRAGCAGSLLKMLRRAGRHLALSCDRHGPLKSTSDRVMPCLQLSESARDVPSVTTMLHRAHGGCDATTLAWPAEFSGRSTVFRSPFTVLR